MPCYQIITCNIELAMANHATLMKALASLGWRVTSLSSRGVLTVVSSQGVTMEITPGQKGSVAIRETQRHLVDSLKVAYSTEIVKESAALNWTVEATPVASTLANQDVATEFRLSMDVVAEFGVNQEEGGQFV